MNITRTIAESVAENMVAPIKSKICTLSQEREKIANDAIQMTIPKDLKECFDKYKSLFQKAECATLLNGAQEVRISNLDYFPAYTTYYPRVEVGSEVVHKVDKLRLKIDKLKDEKEKTYNSIVSTLLSLRTFKRIQEQFPDAYEHLKEYEEAGKTIPSLPIDDILSTINKYK